MIVRFRIVCAYLKMIGKKMEGSGPSDILIEAGIIASGSLNELISVKKKTVVELFVSIKPYQRLLKECYFVILWIPIMKKFLLEPYQRVHLTSSKPLFASITRHNEISGCISEYLNFKQYTRDECSAVGFLHGPHLACPSVDKGSKHQ